MTNEPEKIAAIGFIGFVLALVSLGTAETTNRNDDSVEVEFSARTDHKERKASSGTLQALRQGRSIDLNRASAADLELLPGIGPKLAQRIVADRTRNGWYREVKDLIRVSGIGPTILSRIERLVSTGEGKTEDK